MRSHGRTIALATVLILAIFAGTGEYLRAQARDPEKAAALRRSQNAIPTKPTRPAAGSQIPTPQELAVGERHGPFTNRRQVIPIMNSELTNTITDNGWRGAG